MQFYIVDVFAEKALEGNQLAVIRGNPDSETMQALALEMNYSETTFITDDTMAADGGYNVRIFTTTRELPFAGHPTLGTAFVIRELLAQHQPDTIHLNLKVGQIPVTFYEDGSLWMEQKPPQFGHVYDAAQMAQVLNLDESDIDTRYPVQEVSTGLPFIICPLTSYDAIRRAKVNDEAFRDLFQQGQAALGADATLVFCPEPIHDENDLHVRVFVKEHGVEEDPATGSANGNLAGYLAHYQYFGSPTAQARVEQGYFIERPSLLLLDADATEGKDAIKVRVGGRVQWVAQGELLT